MSDIVWHRLRALTLWRPWPSFILMDNPDAKRVENRPKPPPQSMLGQYFAIHAGRRYEIGSWSVVLGPEQVPPKSACHEGIVGVARIVGWLDVRKPSLKLGKLADTTLTPATLDRISNLDSDPWWAGPVGILLDQVTAIDPVPCKGALGFWRVPIATAAIVRERWEAARC